MTNILIITMGFGILFVLIIIGVKLDTLETKIDAILRKK